MITQAITSASAILRRPEREARLSDLSQKLIEYGFYTSASLMYFYDMCLDPHNTLVLLVRIFVVMNLVTLYQLRISLLYFDDSVSKFSSVELRW
jgi:hypothetical protein